MLETYQLTLEGAGAGLELQHRGMKPCHEIDGGPLGQHFQPLTVRCTCQKLLHCANHKLITSLTESLSPHSTGPRGIQLA